MRKTNTLVRSDIYKMATMATTTNITVNVKNQSGELLVFEIPNEIATIEELEYRLAEELDIPSDVDILFREFEEGDDEDRNYYLYRNASLVDGETLRVFFKDSVTVTVKTLSGELLAFEIPNKISTVEELKRRISKEFDVPFDFVRLFRHDDEDGKCLENEMSLKDRETISVLFEEFITVHLKYRDIKWIPRWNTPHDDGHCSNIDMKLPSGTTVGELQYYIDQELGYPGKIFVQLGKDTDFLDQNIFLFDGENLNVFIYEEDDHDDDDYGHDDRRFMGFGKYGNEYYSPIP